MDQRLILVAALRAEHRLPKLGISTPANRGAFDDVFEQPLRPVRLDGMMGREEVIDASDLRLVSFSHGQLPVERAERHRA